MSVLKSPKVEQKEYNISVEHMEFLESVIDVTDSKTMDEAIEILMDTWMETVFDEGQGEEDTRKSLKNKKK